MTPANPTATEGPALSLLFGYVASANGTDAENLGVVGYLSVDGDGRPVEFLRTEPAVLGPFTRILHGAALARVTQERALGALLARVEQRPQWVFIEDPILRLPNPPTSIDVILIQDSAAPNPHSAGAVLDITVSGRTCRISANDSATLNDVHSTLAALDWNFLEPFQRLKAAHQELTKTES